MIHNQSKINNILKNSLLTAAILGFLALLTFPLLKPNTVSAQDAIETEREKKFEEMLLLNIPAETDNPNFAIVFTDPSGKGIFIAVDGGAEKQVSSPYLLPTLAIGSHKLTIRFTDKEETPQILEKRIVIVPRSPVIKIPQTTTKDTIELNGTAMPNATVRIFMAGPTATYKAEAPSDAEGQWEYIFKDEFSEGIYTITALTTKNGFASLFAEEVIFKISTASAIETDTDEEKKPISFTFDSLISSDPTELFNNNRELIYFVGGTLLSGLILGALLTKIGSGRGTKKAEDQFLKLLREKTTNGIGRSMDIFNAEKSENKVIDKLSKKQEVVEVKATEITATEIVETVAKDGVDTTVSASQTEAVEETIVETEDHSEIENSLKDSTDEIEDSAEETEPKPEIAQELEPLAEEKPVKKGLFGGLFSKLQPKPVEKAEVAVEVEVPQEKLDDKVNDAGAKFDEVTSPDMTDESNLNQETVVEDQPKEIESNSSEDVPEDIPAAYAESPTAKEITKEEFLTKFKEYDPDDDAPAVKVKDTEEQSIDLSTSEDKVEELIETPDIEETRSKFEQSPVKKEKAKKDRNIKITLTTGSLK